MASDPALGKVSGGGVLWLVRKGLKVLDVRRSAPTELAEWLAIRIERTDGAPVWLVACYVRSGDLHWDASFLDNLLASGPVVLCGDFNARHQLLGVTDSRLRNASGKALASFLASGRLVLHGDDSPTRSTGSRVDLWLSSSDMAGNFSDYRVGGLYNSDHHVTVIDARLQATWRAYPKVRFNYNKANWVLFLSILIKALNEIIVPTISSPEEVDRYAEAIVDAILQAAEAAIPRCNAEDLPNWQSTPAIRAAIKQRHRLQRLYRSTGLPVFQHQANCAYDRFKQLVEEAEIQANYRKMRRMERNRRSNLHQFFQLFDQIVSGNASSRANGVQPIHRHDSDSMAVSDSDKAAVIGEHLVKSFRKNESIDSDPDVAKHHVDVDNFIESNPDAFRPLAEAPLSSSADISWREMKKAVKRLKLKAPGHDGISNLLLKRGGPTLWKHLRRLYNMSLACGYVPASWKLAIIVPLPRPGKDHSSPGGYRPVSLLPTIAKLLELIFATRLRDLFELHRLLPQHQGGFRRFRSTVDQTFRFSQLATMARLKREVLVAAFLDFEGAFNAVWHNGLRLKLFQCQHIDRRLVRWLSSFLDSRAFVVRVSASFSSKFAIGSGVPQGSALSPILFVFFTADLLPDSKQPGQANTASYADDVLVFAIACWCGLATARVQAALQKVERWSRRWRLPLNPLKCQVMMVGDGEQQPRLFLNDTVLPYVEAAKYLGVTFDHKMSFKLHIDNIVKDVKVRIDALRRVCHRGSPLSLESKRLLYLTTIRPVLEYSCAAFLSAPDAQLRRLEVLQNDALRAITGSRREEHLDSIELSLLAGVLPLRFRLVQCAAAFGMRGLNNIPLVGEVIMQQRSDLYVRYTPLGAFVAKLPLGPAIGW